MSHVVSRPGPVGTAAAFSVPIFVLRGVSSSLLTCSFRLGWATKRQTLRRGITKFERPWEVLACGHRASCKLFRFVRGTSLRVPRSGEPHHRLGITRGHAQLLSRGAAPTPRGPVSPFFTSTARRKRLRTRCGTQVGR